jgi:hypothetical protein
MTKLQQCKGAADFLRSVYESHYKRKCDLARNRKDCLLKVHALYGEMAEAYVMQSPLSDKELNRCFSKPFNKLFQEIAGEFVASGHGWDEHG